MNDLCHLRAVEMIKKNFGRIRDLPKQVWPVIWVTAYRSCEIAMKIEAIGGSNPIVKSMLVGDSRDCDYMDTVGRGIAKSMLVGDSRDVYELERGIRKIELLQNLLPIIRQAKSKADRLGDSSLLIDILKWDIIDAGKMSILRRIIARRFAKADPLYAYPIPDEIL
jgi:hypothetical protein